MTPIKFVYEVLSLIQMTGAELVLLRTLGQKHYDRTTQAFFTQGPDDPSCRDSPGARWCGQFYFWTNTKPEDNPTGVVDLRVSSKELDVCCYVLSTMAYLTHTQEDAQLLLNQLGPQLRAIHQEYERLNPELVV